MRTKIGTMLLLLFITGCMGRQANPIARYQPGDQKRSCDSLRAEIAENDAQIMKKLRKDASKFWTNAAWRILTPLAMDMKEAEKTEADALQQRNKMLKLIMVEKECSFVPEVKSMKEKKEEAKKKVKEEMEKNKEK